MSKMAKKSESRESLVSRKESLASRKESMLPDPQNPAEVALTAIEKKFLLVAERGDCPSVQKMIDENKENPEFDINCVDPLNRTALIAAIENENLELMQLLIAAGIKVKDALLHAIKEEYVEAVEELLEYEEQNHAAGQPYSWEAVDFAHSSFTPDITPLILAAHMNNYEIIKTLLDRGASLPTPHDVRCGCDECMTSSQLDSLRHSQARINAYRALSSPSLIALSSRDPVLTAFELSWELRRLSRMENEFRDEYNEMREQVQTFVTSLLDHSRTSAELEVILNYKAGSDSWQPGERCTLDCLKLAIDYKQKNFVAHANVQQLLGALWYDGLPGFRRKDMIHQLIEVGKMGAMFPLYSTMYLLAPNSPMAKLMSKPFVKFICHSASYGVFLMLLGAASQRVEYLMIEWFGTDWMQEILADWKRRERGSFPGVVEAGCMLYVFSMICWEMRSIWNEGLMEYICDLWNIVDFFCNMFYVAWIFLRATSIFISWREWYAGWDPYYPREKWDPFDPMLLSEGMFAAGMIFSFLKLVHIFSVNPHLGPLQISLGRMIIDIIKFLIIYMLVLFAFGCGMNKLLWYYAELEKNKCYHPPDHLEIPDFENEDMACTIWRRFANMFETSQSLFWASFGMVDLMAFELTGIKSFTRFWALLMFGSYSVINIIVLLNMLIAMMSNSYQIISERSDTEWKFARSKLWISYFEDGDVVPPPFNLVPGVEFMKKFLGGGDRKITTNSVKAKSRDQNAERYEAVCRALVKRYVMAEQCKRDDFGITEDDVMEIRQDISSMRFELVDILRKNGMKTPDLDTSENALAGKKGKMMERRLLKDFQIGYVEGVINEALAAKDTGEPKDVFSKIAKAIGKRTSKKNKEEWNAEAERRNSRRNLIGSTSEQTERLQSRQSIRRYIIETRSADSRSLDSDKLVAYNPMLRDVSPAARVAYTRFKMRKIQEEYEQEGPEPDDVFEPGTTGGRGDSKTSSVVRPRPFSTSSAKLVKAALKQSQKSHEAAKDVVVQIEPSAADAAPTPAPTPSPQPPTPLAQTAPRPASTKSVKSVKSMAPSERNKSLKKTEAPSRPATPQKEEQPPAPPSPVYVPGKSKVTGKVIQGWI